MAEPSLATTLTAILTGTAPRLVALDLDGTLLTSRGEVGPRTRRALQGLRARGTELLICTGRPHRTALPVLAQLELSGMAALSNGALLYDVGAGRARRHFAIARETLLSALAAMRRRFPDVAAAVETVEGWYTEPAYHARRVLQSELATEPSGIGELAEVIRGPVIKLLFRHPELSAPALAEALAGLPLHPTWAFQHLLEVSAAGVNKARALEWLAGELGIAPEAVVAFGDQNNDKEMLAWAGLGVAMGNAAAEVRAAADLVTASNDEEGIALVLERWLGG